MKATGKLATGRADAVTRVSTARGNHPRKKDRVVFRSFAYSDAQKSCRTLPQNEIGAAIIGKGHNTGTNRAMGRGCWPWSGPWKGDIYRS
jgi:hypothetical protein